MPIKQLSFRNMTVDDQPFVRDMIKAFYQEAHQHEHSMDSLIPKAQPLNTISLQEPSESTSESGSTLTGHCMNDQRIDATFEHFQTHPQSGSILVIEQQARLVGYAILVNFWSNEYGGNLLVIDELYLTQPSRGNGIGSAFLDHLIQSRYNNWVGLRLEVLPYNQRALQLYEKMGFKKSDRSYLLLFE